MFLTVTANPSVDRTVEVERLTRGALHRGARVYLHPGGKGVNVARALVRNGCKARAVVPVGGTDGQQLVSMLVDHSIEVVRVPARGQVRGNITVVEPDATVTKLNEAGARLSTAEIQALNEAVLKHLAGVDWVVAAGSLPPGVPDRFYADLVHEIRPTGAQVAVDTSGPALLAAVRAAPALVKPNLDELREAAGCPLTTLRDVVVAAEQLRAYGVEAVLASLGKHGAVLVDGAGVWHAEAPAQPRSSVGAGDALLAGFLSAGARGPDALVVGVAWGAAAVSLPGSTMPGPHDVHVHQVVLHSEVAWNRRIDE
ncbi:1-phosphofructokinase [Kibdelosporangium aridum]|uniref:1-phosphofructokinase n=1 Tax=Kibdelosporangium aridum TaxID=2030 RepID=UPI0005255A4A